MRIFDLFKEIESTPKSSVKKKILSENLNQNIKIIFDDTYNTSRQYYIKKLDLSNNKINQFGELTIDDNYNIFHEGLNKLNNREITGTTRILTYARRTMLPAASTSSILTIGVRPIDSLLIPSATWNVPFTLSVHTSTSWEEV